MQTVHPTASTLGRYIPLVMLSTKLNFGGILPEKISMIFFVKFKMRLSLIEHSICHILGMVGPAKMVRLPRNRKQTYRLNARPQMGSSGLTLNFQGQIWNLLYLEKNGLIAKKTKANISIELHASNVTMTLKVRCEDLTRLWPGLLQMSACRRLV